MLRKDRGLLDVVEFREFLVQVLVALRADHPLLGGLAVAGVDAVHDVHALDDGRERRESLAVQLQGAILNASIADSFLWLAKSLKSPDNFLCQAFRRHTEEFLWI